MVESDVARGKAAIAYLQAFMRHAEAEDHLYGIGYQLNPPTDREAHDALNAVIAAKDALREATANAHLLRIGVDGLRDAAFDPV